MTPEVISAEWEKEESFFSKLNRLDDVVAAELDRNEKVSLIGASAAGPLVISALIEQPNIHRVITLSSRLRGLGEKNRLAMEALRAISPAAAEGIIWIEGQQGETLTPQIRKKIMNTRVLSGDKQVPPEASYIDGACNLFLPPVSNHMQAVSKALTEHGDIIVAFLKQP